MSNNSSRIFYRTSLKSIISIKKLISIYNFDFSPSFCSKGESHDFWEMNYVVAGKLNILSGNKNYSVSQKQIFIHRPNDYHIISCDGVHSASFFVISFECSSSLMNLFCDNAWEIPLNLTTLLRLLMEECNANFYMGAEYPLNILKSAPLGGQQLTRLYLEEFLIRMLRHLNKQTNPITIVTSAEAFEDNICSEISSFMLSHLQERITLQMISKEFHLGKSQLCKIFKRGTGSSILHYFLLLKITEAKKMLRENNLTISEISDRLAFENEAYFSRVFKKHTGMSPTMFRNKQITNSVLLK